MSEDAILAIDIGGGTQDILLWDPDQRLENCVKLVLPSPTRVAASKIRAVTARGRTLFLDGVVMGGGAVTSAVKSHLKAGLAVYATPEAALTFHDNLDYVRDMGVTIGKDAPQDAETVTLGDLDLAALAGAVAPFGVELPARVAVAVQDHGFAPHESNRLARFANLKSFLENGGTLADRVYLEPPAENTRMWAIKRAAPGALLMDTGTAAIMGALLDSTVAQWRDTGVLALNLGNAHTMAAIVKGDAALALYEHHTSLLEPSLLRDHMGRFMRRELAHEEIFRSMGHGVAYASGFAGADTLPVAVTGPQRVLARGMDCHLASPFGDMMLSGSFGLVAGAKIKWNISHEINP